jgi:hypothetical protein
VHSDGITALTVQLIPGRRLSDRTTRRGYGAARVSKPVRRRHGGGRGGSGPEQRPTPGNRQLDLLTQAHVAEAPWEGSHPPSGAGLDEFTTYQVDGSVVDYGAIDG